MNTMDTTITAVLGTGVTAVGVMIARFFFDRWNNKPKSGSECITEKRCCHTRGNCTNNIGLKQQHLEMDVAELKIELKTVKGVMLQVASYTKIPMDNLTKLTS